MKMKLFYSTALALAVAMASTGCKHKPVAVTPIPQNQAMVNDQNPYPQTIQQEPPINNLPPVNGGPAPIATTDWNPADFVMDRDTLAADTIHFAFDSAVVRDSEQANLQAVASAMQADPNLRLLIEGNCDERGTEEYNRSLGERRALAAREALAKLGIDPMRVHEISYGKDKPADPGHDEEAWTKNRRDDFVLLHPKTGV